jgi:hypothetical protein
VTITLGTRDIGTQRKPGRPVRGADSAVAARYGLTSVLFNSRGSVLRPLRATRVAENPANRPDPAELPIQGRDIAMTSGTSTLWGNVCGCAHC